MDNAIWLTAHAYVHNSVDVQLAAEEIIVKNFPTIIEKPEWKEFVKNHPDLLEGIHEELASRIE